MRVLCLNCWGGTLADALLDYIASTGADVLCLQEVIHTPSAPAQVLTYRDAFRTLPQRARLLDELSAVLPDHHVTFCPTARGPLWHGDTAYPSLWGIATFTRKSLPVIAQTSRFVHGAFGEDGFGDEPRSRTAHALRLWAGRPITIAHMHGLRAPAGKGDTPARAAQADRFIALVQNVAAPGDSLILCGDFNVRPDSETITKLRALGLTERVTADGHKTTRTAHYTKPEPYADYMFVSKDLKDAPFQVITNPEPSDHTPLILTLPSSG
ncbi:MAG: endonuclease/exonuclease/phosphatase family protein [Pseudomonadota bacterium]